MTDEQYQKLCDAFDCASVAAGIVNELIDQSAPLSGAMGVTFQADLVRMRSLLEMAGICIGEHIPEHVETRSEEDEADGALN